MKLTGELKKQVEKTDNMDEKKRLIEENRSKKKALNHYREVTIWITEQIRWADGLIWTNLNR